MNRTIRYLSENLITSLKMTIWDCRKILFLQTTQNIFGQVIKEEAERKEESDLFHRKLPANNNFANTRKNKMKNLTITERRNNSTIILDLDGNIRLGEGSRELHEAIRLIVEKSEKELLLNLANVSYVDSSGLGEIVAGYTTLQKSGGQMKLLNLTDRVSELMVITKLLTVFEVYENEEQAVNSFQNASEYIKLNQSTFVTGELDKALLN